MGDMHILDGMSKVVNIDNVKKDVDLSQIEKKLISGYSLKSNSNDNRFEEELARASKTLGVNFGDVTKILKQNTPKPNVPPPRTAYIPEPRRESPPPEEDSDEPSSDDEVNSDEHDNYDGLDDSRDDAHDDARDDAHDDSRDDARNPWGQSEPYISNSKTMEERTNEQIRRQKIDSVTSSFGNISADGFDKDRNDDNKFAMLEEIESLLASDESEESNIKINVTKDSTYAEVETALKILRHKHDRIRFVSMADEIILAGCCCMEEVFDGKREWFGKYRPNLKGWNYQVAAKLRRMRHDTSEIVSGVMKDGGIGPVTRFALELLPNMFMYSRRLNDQEAQSSATDISQAKSRLRDTL